RALRTCLICRGARFRVVFREFGIDVLRCEECGHVCSSHQGDPGYAAYYQDNPTDWEDPYWWDEAHREMYDDFCSRFLEGRPTRPIVGCGFCVGTAYLAGC
ncbi:MAG: hypothetical protein ACKV22_26895, partial [Bryobacteraceae bacterium]